MKRTDAFLFNCGSFLGSVLVFFLLVDFEHVFVFRESPGLHTASQLFYIGDFWTFFYVFKYIPKILSNLQTFKNTVKKSLFYLAFIAL